MNIEDIPPDIVIAIVRHANKKRYDIKWKANIKLTPEMEDIWLRLAKEWYIMGALKGYDLGVNGVKEDDE